MRKLVIIALSLAAFSAAAQAGPLLLYTVALPASNDVSLSGAYVVPGGNPGDQFQLSAAAIANAFSVWFVGTTTAGNSTGPISGDNPSTEFAATGLYIGADSGTAMAQVGGAPTYTAVTYPDGSNYQNTPGSYSQLYEATWSGLNLFLTGDLYDFAIATTSSSAYILTSTCAPAVMGCVDGLFLGYTDPTDNTTDSTYNGIGDVNADVNVAITGDFVPEPGTWLLICAGAGVLALSRSRRRG